MKRTVYHNRVGFILGGLIALWGWLILEDGICRLAGWEFRPIIRAVVLFALPFFYGSWRIRAFHPAADDGHFDWLRRTPWRPGRSLPLGPTTPHWLDLAVLALFTAMVTHQLTKIVASTEHRPIDAKLLVPGFLTALVVATTCSILAYVVSSWRILLRTGAYRLLFLSLGIFSLMVHDVIYRPELEIVDKLNLFEWKASRLLPELLILFAVSWIGLARGLRRFPWTETLDPDGKLFTVARSKPVLLMPWYLIYKSRADVTKLSSLMHQTAPTPARRGISREMRLYWSLLNGWGVFLFGHAAGSHHNAPADEFEALWTMVFIVAIGLATVRLILYVVGHLPPISLWGRLITLRWIVPGYDYILVTPLAIVILGTVLPPALDRLGASLSLNAGVGVSALLAFTLLAGPSYNHWHRTGKHRIVPINSQLSQQAGYEQTSA